VVVTFQEKFKRPPIDVVLLWDAVDRVPIAKWKVGFHQAAALSRNGRRVATYSAGHIRVWDAATGGPVAAFPEPAADNRVVALVIDPRGDRVALVLATEVHVWDVPSRRLIRTIDTTRRPYYPYLFSPDGDVFACQTVVREVDFSRGGGHVLTAWDVTRGRELFQMRREAPFPSPAFSPDGKLLAVPEANVIHLLAFPSGERLATLRGHSTFVGAVAFAPDGRRLFTGSTDSNLEIWNVEPWGHEGA
jgi:WD40 repeat protein